MDDAQLPSWAITSLVGILGAAVLIYRARTVPAVPAAVPAAAPEHAVRVPTSRRNTHTAAADAAAASPAGSPRGRTGAAEGAGMDGGASAAVAAGAAAFEGWSVKRMKQWLQERGVSFADCVEKSELVARCVSANASSTVPAAQALSAPEPESAAASVRTLAVLAPRVGPRWRGEAASPCSKPAECPSPPC